MNLQAEPAIRAARFGKHVGIVARANQLDPELPELLQLMVRPDATSDEDPDGMRWLRKLNPHGMAHYAEPGRLVVPTQLGEAVLSPWTVARWHVPNLDSRLRKIAATATGCHLYIDACTIGVTFQDGAINPHRLDHLAQCEKAAAIIDAFTGTEIKWQYHLRRTRSIMLTRSTDSWGDSWNLEYV